jgi:hypothetical protein
MILMGTVVEERFEVESLKSKSESGRQLTVDSSQRTAGKKGEDAASCGAARPELVREERQETETEEDNAPTRPG